MGAALSCSDSSCGQGYKEDCHRCRTICDRDAVASQQVAPEASPSHKYTTAGVQQPEDQGTLTLDHPPSLLLSHFGAARRAHLFEGEAEKHSLPTETPASGSSQVPHARRGVTLGQLQDLLRVFVESHWLAQRCAEYNMQHAQEISLKQLHSMAENLYAIDRFLVKPFTCNPQLAELPEELRELGKSAFIPRAKRACSYSELLNPDGLLVHYFVSHAWVNLFGTTMQALHAYAARKFQDLGTSSSELVVFWICLFSLNQFLVQDELGASLAECPFKFALQSSKGAIMILDGEVHPFRRIWCLYEVDMVCKLQKPLELVTDLGPLLAVAEDPNDLVLQKRAIEQLQDIGDALSKISARDAEASSEDDKLAIWHSICAPSSRKLPLKLILEYNFFDRANAFSTFDDSVGALLATYLFRASLSNQDLDNCLCYLGLGACINTLADLKAVRALGCDTRTATVQRRYSQSCVQPCSLLFAAASFGHMAAAKLLLDNNSDVCVGMDNGNSPLHAAAEYGHMEVLKLLVEHSANINARSACGGTALEKASTAGHVPIVEFLLEHKADVHLPFIAAPEDVFCSAKSRREPKVREERDAVCRGHQPIHGAAYYGHIEVVRLLLDHRAGIMAIKEDGSTPLHLAKFAKHSEIAELLIERGASA